MMHRSVSLPRMIPSELPDCFFTHQTDTPRLMTRPTIGTDGQSYESGELPCGSGAVRNRYLEKAMDLHPDVMWGVRTAQTLRQHHLPPPAFAPQAPPALPRSASLPRFDAEDPPECFACCIDSGTPVMTQPVTTADGMTYQKRAIADYFAIAGEHPRSPLTGETLVHARWVPNRGLEAAMRWHPQLMLQQRALRTLEVHEDARQAQAARTAAQERWRNLLRTTPTAAALAAVGSWLGGYGGTALQAGLEAALPGLTTQVGWGNALAGTYVGGVITAATLARGIGRRDVADEALRFGVHGVVATTLVALGASLGAATIMGMRTIDCIMEGQPDCLVDAGMHGALFGALVAVGLVALWSADA